MYMKILLAFIEVEFMVVIMDLGIKLLCE